MAGSRLSWPVRIMNQGKVLVERALEVAPSSFYRTEENIYLFTGNGDAGLKVFLKPLEQHEQTVLVRGFPLNAIPDRPMGLSAADLLIWASPSSSDSRISLNQLSSLDQWVTQGGHLVVGLGGNLPHPLRTYAKESPGLSPLMMENNLEISRISGDIPRVLGASASRLKKEERETFFYDVFSVGGIADVSAFDGSGYVVLHKDNQNKPLVITKQVGLGRVTYLGVDLKQITLQRLGLPSGISGFWQTIMSWQRSGFTEAKLKKVYNDPSVLSHQPILMGRFLDDLIAMRQAAGPALLLLMLSFGVYWLVAGPGIHVLLKNREKRIYSWYFFALAGAVFSVMAWAAAKLMNPGISRVEHYSVVQSVKQANQPEMIKVKSYLSLLVPEHRTSEFKVNTYAGETATISSPGDPTRSASSRFQYPRVYDINCAKPGEMSPPMRATAKSLEINGYFTPKVGDDDRWAMPEGTVALNENGGIEVDLINRLPAAVENLSAVIVWPGQEKVGQSDKQARQAIQARRSLKNIEVVSFSKELEQEDKLAITFLPPKAAERATAGLRYKPFLVKRTIRKNNEVKHVWQGALGEKLSSALKNASSFSGQSLGTLRSQSELLSFFDVLPLEIKKDDYYNYSSYRLVRRYGREFDLSAHLSLPCVILMGYVKDSNLPLQLEVDGRQPDATGWTMVQWIYPL